MKLFSVLSASALALLAMTILVPSAQTQQTPADAPLTPVKIALVGDSTVAPGGGWGNAFGTLLKPPAQCVNLALNGRSSKSYRDEGHWKEVLVQKPNYVLLQFGHNDQPGKGPERETGPNTTYAQNMGRYVDEVRAIGAKPVLVTSLTRRQFGADGRIKSDLGPYVAAVAQVAKDKGVPLVDLNARSIELMNLLGPVSALKYDKPSADPAKPDRTHLSEVGGQATAILVAREVQRVVPELKPYFVALPVMADADVLNNRGMTAPGAAPKADFVVAADGSGQFKTLQAAIDAAPANSEKRVVIFIKPGVYKAHLVVPQEKTNLALVGQDATTTLLTNDVLQGSLGPDGKPLKTQEAASTFIAADGF